ncbi:hypothetical protein ABT095_19005 [Kitasatospora sp. NPDC002227]|uniref:hypothetical protein n=1 Tax=Kitasatospora sp. NPDC002227 TaxID=3154773 RepID=UPI00331D542C
MKRLALVAAGALGLAVLATGPASADTTTTVTTCGAGGLQSGLWTKACVDITGTSVVAWGQIGLAGPPSPGSPELQWQQLYTSLDASVVGGASLGSSNQWTNFKASTVRVDGVSGTAACGSTVHVNFTVNGPNGWGPRTVTADVPVNC